MPRVRWVDNKVMSARSWEGLLLKVLELPWNSYMDKVELREALAKRAYVWSLRHVDPTLPARELFEALEKAGVLVIEVGRRS